MTPNKRGPRFRLSAWRTLAICFCPLAFALHRNASLADTSTNAPDDILRANLDASVNPGDDFFTYANGAWLRRNPIPASESSWGIAKVVREELYVKLRKINELAVAGSNPNGSEPQKIADFWTTAMDTNKADRVGLEPLRPLLERIDSARTVQDVLDISFALQPLDVTALFNFSVNQDEKTSDVMSVHLVQGGLGLPERDFYFNPEQGVARIREEYVAHIARTLQLLGQEAAAARTAATNIMGFETALARASRKLEDLRDPEKNYNKMTPAELTEKHSPAILWTNRLAIWTLHPSYVIVGQPEFFDALNGLLGSTPLPVLQDYLRFHLAADYSQYLSKAFEDEHFVFSEKVLSGQQEPRPRWKQALDAQESAMGMILGKLFVKQYFPPATKKRYADLVEAIRSAYRERINRLDWMSADTKAKALQKLAALNVKVGYPDKWKDYSALVVGTGSYCENMMHAARWRFNDMISKFGKPVDRTEWEMTPQTYNAYYKPENNEIVLPAAAFAVPGRADSELDDALVYGYAAASTIGHEITHGFDDEGRQFDAAGNLTNWWTEADADKFKQRAQLMVEQFDAYQPLPGLHINGRASLGENIADYGGVLLGLDAFKKTEQYRSGEKIGGFTPMQRFFLGYALSWLFQQQEALLRRGLLSDVHAPPKWRVLGPLANVPEFYQAFGVKTNQPMWRPPNFRVSIW
jgi:putative endopeptidase